MSESYNSIIFGNFQQPITTVVHSLVRRERESVDWKTNEGDLDWIISGTLLTVAMLECALRWTHVHKCSTMKNEGLYLYEDLRSQHPDLPDVREIFVMRNAIAHGHVWDVPVPPPALAWLPRLPRFLRGRKDTL
jgi:hypothetical protein